MSKKLLRIAGSAAVVGSVLVNGIAYAAVPTLNQTNVTVGVGQSATINSSNVSVYMLSNSDGTVVSVSTNGNQVTVTGQALGGALVRICAVGTASDCTNLNVTVQAGSVATVSFNPNNFSLAVGGSQAVAISGGNGTYSISGSASTTVASATLASSTLSISAIAAGSASFTVCDSASLCGNVSVTVTSGSNPNQAVTFSNASPSLAVGQTTTLTVSGTASSFVILTNTKPEVLQATMTSGITLSLTGVQNGTSSLVICGVGSDCSTLPVTVTSASGSTSSNTTSTTSSTTATTTSLTGTTSQSTTTTTPSNTSVSTGGSVNSAALLSQITALQNAVAQILSQLQSVQTQLVQLKAQVTAGASVSSNAPAATVLTEFLTLGSEGPQVTLLQQKLSALGLYAGPITGYYGPLTQQAVMKYQTAHGITATGYVGPSTRAALNLSQ